MATALLDQQQIPGVIWQHLPVRASIRESRDSEWTSDLHIIIELIGQMLNNLFQLQSTHNNRINSKHYEQVCLMMLRFKRVSIKIFLRKTQRCQLNSCKVCWN